jgi:hypothetical protein
VNRYSPRRLGPHAALVREPAGRHASALMSGQFRMHGGFGVCDRINRGPAPCPASSQVQREVR